ncbi:MAG: LysR family transcriptional regulator [Pseudomonadota bacterium]
MDLKQSDIGLLLALDALLDTCSVTEAAARIGVSQPAMSAQLARLRTLFGDSLLVPSGRRMVPTPRALDLQPDLHALLRGMEGLVKAGRPFDPGATRETFALLATDYAHAVIGPGLLALLAEEAPGARLAFLPSAAAEVWPSLESTRADLALATGIRPPEARTRAGLAESFVTVVRKDHPEAAAMGSLDGLCAADHLLVSPQGGGFEGAIDKALAGLQRRRRVACSVASFLLAPALVASSNYACVLPRRIARLYEGALTASELPFPSPEFTVDLFWHPRRQDDPAHIWFRNQVLRVIRGLA